MTLNIIFSVVTKHVSETISECISEWAPFGFGCGGHAQHGASSFTEIVKISWPWVRDVKIFQQFLHNLHQVSPILIFKILFFSIFVRSRFKLSPATLLELDRRNVSLLRCVFRRLFFGWCWVAFRWSVDWIGSSDFEFFDIIFSLVFDQFFSFWVG